ncbi:hypothetical protein CHLNCDRAFT_137958 [Chlorella variabilis]|uniref:SET domain-containing protein n=1 Tax=Chlorella variabilis TaxID=554065 RepID=E1Z4Y1_CHLVA|nr:hypothetical protein CHLNCDRAFT_137958 [Chlorella variabilis]EFN59137.1 hypothetical protein CHLNCDRAFT_137958 [Chlorella variabilis]|eukprot:XP_005851239.1 hypothetical protein CHLNCDRAFT_137958 [Chlorella variabilis]
MLPFEIENLVDEEAGPPGFLWMDECDPAAVDDRMPDHAGCFGGCGLVLSSAGSQQPAVTLQKRSGKGWGVYADEPLPAGSLLGQYGGEYISNAEAQRRLKEYDTSGGGHALLVLREWLPSGTAAIRLNIDATRRGNLARFFNHSCDGGNLQLLLARHTGCLLPRVVFVTSRAVQQGEELTCPRGAPLPYVN